MKRDKPNQPGHLAKGLGLPPWSSTGWNERQKRAAAARKAKREKA